MNRTKAITKTLSRNDTGETGGHQAGILIPKREEIISFFPELNKDEKNPRYPITFVDAFGERWSFSFIYYNNSFFGGTRNEYRLTGITKFVKAYNLRAGDEITLERDGNGFYTISHSKNKIRSAFADGKLILGNSWKVVKI